MKFVAYDTETFLIAPGMLAPRLVCASWYDGMTGGVVHRDAGALALAMQLLADPHTTVVFHNAPFDLGVLAAEAYERGCGDTFMELVLSALDAGRIRDTKVRQRLIDIAAGLIDMHGKPFREVNGKLESADLSLAALSVLHLKEHLEKEDTWRLRYAELSTVPIERWPVEAVSYAAKDADTTLKVFMAQQILVEREGASLGAPIPDEIPQTASAWSLHLMSMWGVRTRPETVALLKDVLEAEQEVAKEQLAASGIFRPNGTKDITLVRQMVREAYVGLGAAVPETDGGQVAYSRDVLLESACGDLLALATSGRGAKLLSTYVPVLEAGTRTPICASYNVLVESGRTSCARPNMQTPPREGGARECFVPRPGFIYCAADYDTLELRALAQVCLDLVGRSEMAEALRRGEDLHLSLASQMGGCSVEEIVAKYAAGDPQAAALRQHAKAGNFGFPGGMSPRGFVNYARNYGLRLELRDATMIHAGFHRRWPEVRKFFDVVYSQLRACGLGGQEGRITQLRSGRVRGAVTFTSAANSFFQGLAADGAKAALRRVVRECYGAAASPLRGCRPVIFMHDEIIMEVPELPRERADGAAGRLAEIMISEMGKFVPDVPITTKPALMRRWLKGAKPVRVDGLLVPSKQNGKNWEADLL